MSAIKVHIEEIEDQNTREFIEDTATEKLAENIESFLENLIISTLIGLNNKHNISAQSDLSIRFGEIDQVLRLETNISTRFGLNDYINQPDIEFVDEEEDADFVISVNEDQILETIGEYCRDRDYYDLEIDYPYTYDDEEYDEIEHEEAYMDALNAEVEQCIENFDLRDLAMEDIVHITPKVSLIKLINICLDEDSEEGLKTKKTILRLLNNKKEIKDIDLNEIMDDFFAEADYRGQWDMEFLIDGEDILSLIEPTSKDNITPEEKEEIDYLCKTWDLGFKTNWIIRFYNDNDRLIFTNGLQLHNEAIESQINQQSRKIIDQEYDKIISEGNSHLEFLFEDISYAKSYSTSAELLTIPLSSLIVSKSPIISYDKRSKKVNISSKVLNILDKQLKLKIRLDCKLPYHVYDAGIKIISIENINIGKSENIQTKYYNLLSKSRLIDKDTVFSWLPEDFEKILSSNWSDLFEYLSVNLGRYTHKKGQFINGTSYDKDKVMAYNADLINFCIGRGIDESYFDIIEDIDIFDSRSDERVFKTNTLRLTCLIFKDPSKALSKPLIINLDNSIVDKYALYISNILNSTFYCEKLTLKTSRIIGDYSTRLEDILYANEVSIDADPLILLSMTKLSGVRIKASDKNINEIIKSGMYIDHDKVQIYSIDDISLFEKYRKSLYGKFIYIDTKGITDLSSIVNYLEDSKELTLYSKNDLIKINEDGKSFIPVISGDGKDISLKVYEIGFLNQLFNGITSLEMNNDEFNKSETVILKNELEEHNFTQELFENSIIEPTQISIAIQNAIGSKANLTYTEPLTRFLSSNFNERLIHGKLGYEKNINLFTSYYIHSVMCRMSLRGSEHIPYTTEEILLATLLDCLGAKDLNEMITTNRYSVLNQLASGQYIGGFISKGSSRFDLSVNMNNHLSCYVNYITSILNDYLDPLALLLSHRNYLLRSNPSGLEVPAPYSTQYKPKTIIQTLKICLPNILDPNQCDQLFDAIGSNLNLELTDNLIDIVTSCPDPSIFKEEIKDKFSKNFIVTDSREREKSLEKLIEDLGDDENSRLLKRVYSRHIDTLQLSYNSAVYSDYSFKLTSESRYFGKIEDNSPISQISALTFNSYNESRYEINFSVLYRSLVYLYEFAPLLRLIYEPEDSIEKTFALIVKGEDASGFSYTIDLESIIRDPYYDNVNVEKLLKNKPVSRVLPKLDAQGNQVVENGSVVYEQPIKVPYIYNSDDNPIDYHMIREVLNFNKDSIPKSRLRENFRSRIPLSNYFTILDLIYNAYNVFKKRFTEVESRALITSDDRTISIDAVFYDKDGNKLDYEDRQNVLKELGSSHRICIGDKGRTYDLENRKDACEVITVTISGFITAFLYMSKGLLREVKGSYNTVVGSSASKRVNAYGFEISKESLDKALNQLKKVSIENIAIVLKSMEMLGIERLIRPFGDSRRIYPNDTDALILVSGLIDAPEALNLINQGDTESISESISAISDTYQISYEEALSILNNFYNENNIKYKLERSKTLVKRSDFRSGAWK